MNCRNIRLDLMKCCPREIHKTDTTDHSESGWCNCSTSAATLREFPLSLINSTELVKKYLYRKLLATPSPFCIGVWNMKMLRASIFFVNWKVKRHVCLVPEKMTQFLPPNLLALFAPRDPIPYLPPVSKLPHEKKNGGYIGVGAFLKYFEVIEVYT